MAVEKKLKMVAGAALAALLVLPGAAEKAEVFENPVIATDWPDPAIWRADGKFYSVATSLRTIRSSADGISWTDTGIDPLSPSARQKLYSISKNLWAPCVVRLNGRWVLYISVFISTPDDRIVALTSDSPTGPFEFAAEVVNGPKLGIMNAIDPYVVRTEGRTWMFFGSCQDGIHRVELSADGLSMLPGASPVHVAGRRSPYGPDGKWIQIWGQPGTWEGSFLFQRQGWWYLFFSGGIYRDHTYHLMVGRSRSIDGVFVNREGEELTRGKASPILFSDQGDKFYGPGHNGEIIVAEDGRNFMFYHSHDTAFKPAERPTFLQELIWDADGWPTFDGGKPKRFERRFKAAGLSNDRTDSATGLSASAEDIDCIAIYYPHWHKYPRGTEWFGKDWDQGEWHLARTAKRRFPGHKAPITPLYGYIDGKDPKDVEKEIALAANAGITVFMYDFYWYGGEMTMQESLEQGFLKARNRDRLKFCLMWCYHDRVDSFRDNPREPKRMLMPLARTEEEFLGLIRYATEHYFREPNHWTRDGKPFFSIYNARAFLKDRGGVEGTRAALDKARDIAKAAGLKGIFFEAMNPENAKDAREMADAGFDILGNYALAPNYQPELRKEARAGRPLYDYETYTLPFHRRQWSELRDASRLAYIPAVTAGRDASMRCANEEPFPWKTLRYPYDGIATNNNPNAFERLVREAKASALADPKKPGAISIYGWNEYTEGGYIAPNNYDADGALRAVAAVFGRRPANEYTYVNPSSRQLYTIPAADYENVAYGPHSKQKVDVFLPKGMKGPFPVVQYVHGGGWSSGAMEDHILGSSIRMLLANGIAVVGTGYRYIGDCVLEGVKPPVRGCLDDCEAAVRFVQAKAAEWNLDMSRLALAGGSAGACTCLYLGLKDNNALGIKALAPIIPQTSVDPKEMREWIPNSTYGAHAFGYRNFDDWLAHRADCLADIQRISPAELLRRIDAAKAPHVVFQAGRLPKPGQLVEPTHSPVFCAKFKEIADAKGVVCEFIQGGRLPCYGEAFVRIAEILTGRKKANLRGIAAERQEVRRERDLQGGGRDDCQRGAEGVVRRLFELARSVGHECR